MRAVERGMVPALKECGCDVRMPFPSGVVCVVGFDVPGC